MLLCLLLFFLALGLIAACMLKCLVWKEPVQTDDINLQNSLIHILEVLYKSQGINVSFLKIYFIINIVFYCNKKYAWFVLKYAQVLCILGFISRNACSWLDQLIDLFQLSFHCSSDTFNTSFPFAPLLWMISWWTWDAWSMLYSCNFKNLIFENKA